MRNAELAKKQDLEIQEVEQEDNVVEFTNTLKELRKHIDPNLVRQREGWRDRNGTDRNRGAFLR